MCHMLITYNFTINTDIWNTFKHANESNRWIITHEKIFNMVTSNVSVLIVQIVITSIDYQCSIWNWNVLVECISLYLRFNFHLYWAYYSSLTHHCCLILISTYIVWALIDQIVIFDIGHFKILTLDIDLFKLLTFDIGFEILKLTLRIYYIWELTLTFYNSHFWHFDIKH